MESGKGIQVFTIAASRSAGDTGAGTGRLRKLVISDCQPAESATYGLVDTVDPGIGAANTVNKGRHLNPVNADRSPEKSQRNNAKGAV